MGLNRDQDPHFLSMSWKNIFNSDRLYTLPYLLFYPNQESKNQLFLFTIPIKNLPLISVLIPGIEMSRQFARIFNL
jgi:hypothetical protein